MDQESDTSSPVTDTDREIRQWAVERAIESTGHRPAGSSPAQRRADVLAAAKEFEAYVQGPKA